jgi:hypothetical protein
MIGSRLRTLHRDLGFLAFGLTIVYAVSGIAVNHIGTWDPNFIREERVADIGPLTGTPSAMAARGDGSAGLAPKEWSVSAVADSRLDISFKEGQAYRQPAQRDGPSFARIGPAPCCVR